MNILIIGEEVNFIECQQKFGKSHSYTLTENQKAAQPLLKAHDIIFDFCIEKDPAQMSIYNSKAGLIVFLNTSKISLTQLSANVPHTFDGYLFGFAGMPSFLNREILETSLSADHLKSEMEEICLKLNTKYQIVEDRVGLVTPRVICMIINEAYYTVEEGTATREDIDLAMKLGTNYPYGPFEWCRKIGTHHVVELLEAVFNDTKDERYKICSLCR